MSLISSESTVISSIQLESKSYVVRQKKFLTFLNVIFVPSIIASPWNSQSERQLASSLGFRGLIFVVQMKIIHSITIAIIEAVMHKAN